MRPSLDIDGRRQGKAIRTQPRGHFSFGGWPKNHGGTLKVPMFSFEKNCVLASWTPSQHRNYCMFTQMDGWIDRIHRK